MRLGSWWAEVIGVSEAEVSDGIHERGLAVLRLLFLDPTLLGVVHRSPQRADVSPVHVPCKELSGCCVRIRSLSINVNMDTGCCGNIVWSPKVNGQL